MDITPDGVATVTVNNEDPVEAPVTVHHNGVYPILTVPLPELHSGDTMTVTWAWNED